MTKFPGGGIIFKHCAGVMELADVTDSKSVGSNTVRVQVPPPAPDGVSRIQLCASHNVERRLFYFETIHLLTFQSRRAIIVKKGL